MEPTRLRSGQCHPAVRHRTPAPHQVQSCAASDSESSSSSEDYQPPAVSNNTYFKDTKPSSDWQKWLCTLSGPPWYWSQEKSTPACLPNETAVGGHGTRKWQPWVFGLDNGDSVWIKWVDKPLQAKTKTPGTPISYLTSMQMFLTYLTRQKHDPRVHATAFPHPQANLHGAYPGIKRMESLYRIFPTRLPDKQVHWWVQLPHIHWEP